MALFADRTDAGRDLAAALRPWAGTDAVVVGIPRGGVVVAAAVAAELALPLTAVAVRKLGAPGREEFAIGAIAEDVRVLDERMTRSAGVTDAQLAAVEQRERAELARRRALFAGRGDVRGRPALVVDDGIATGSTALAACRALRAQGPSRIVLAVPVAPADWRPDTEAVDEFVCPHREPDFWAVGQFYTHFEQTEDAEVIALLARDLRAG